MQKSFTRPIFLCYNQKRNQSEDSRGAAEKREFMEQVRVGFVGVGGRGRGLIMMMLDHMSIAKITAICDLYPDRVENMQKLVQEKLVQLAPV